MSRLLVLLVVFLLTAGMAAAATGDKTLRPLWALGIPEEVGFDENGTNGFLHALGDADADGKADLLAGTSDGGLHVLAGPDLDRVVWGLPEAGGSASTVPDLTGDGVPDVVARGAFTGSFTGQGVGQMGVSASASENEFRFTQLLLDGATGNVVTQLDAFDRSTGAGATIVQLQGPIFTFNTVRASSAGGASELLVGPDQVWRMENERATAFAFAYNPVESLGQSASVPLRTSVVRSDFQERDKFTIAFDQPARMLLSLGFLDMTGDQVLDVLLIDVPRPIEVNGEDTSYGADRWTAYDGDTGAVLWEQEGEPGVRRVFFHDIYVYPVGDVDGDGSGDMAVFELEWGTTSMVDAMRILSGADGSLLYDGSGAAGFVPFGDVDGDGVDEFLVVRQRLDDYEVALTNVDEERWRIGVTEMSEPINWVEMDELRPFSDLTGDGVPDLLMAEWSDDPEEGDAEVMFWLVDGATGDAGWERHVGSILSSHATADITGDGLADLVYIEGLEEDGSQSGYYDGTNHTMRIHGVRGTDGKAVWSRTILDPVLAGDRNITKVDGWSSSARDVDGDGADDLLIGMASMCGYILVETGGSFDVVPEDGCEEFGQKLILSGRAGGLLFMLPDLVQPQRSGADPLPAVERGEAFDDVVGAPKESPAPALFLALALLALVRLRRR